MTVNATPRVAGPFAGNAVTTAFPFAFKVYSKADLRVVLTDADDVESVAVLDSEYSVSLNADQESAPGGSVTYPLAGSPLPSGHKLTIVGATAATQPLDVTNQGGFYPQVIEDALDRTTILAQENADAIERCVKVAVSSDLDPDQLVADIVASEAAAASSAAQSAGSANAAQVSADDSATTAAASAASAAASLASANNSATSATAPAGSAPAPAGSASTAATDAAAGADAAMAASLAAAAGSATSAATSATNAATSATNAAASAGTAAADAAAGADAAMAASLAAAASSASDAAASASAAASAFAPFKNKLINGNFDFWQRGTSFGIVAGGRYTSDRWRANIVAGTSGGFSVFREAMTPGTLPSNPSYYARLSLGSGFAGNDWAQFRQPIENLRQFSGKTLTVSLWAKADSARNLPYNFNSVYGTGGSPSATEIVGSGFLSLTTSWQKFEFSLTVPDMSGKTFGSDGNSTLLFTLWPVSLGSNTAANSLPVDGPDGTFNISIGSVQLEEGATATPFEQRPPGIELTLCRRYFRKSFPMNVAPAQNAGTPGALGYRASVTGAGLTGMPVTFDPVMRSAPTMTFFNPAASNALWRNVSNASDSGAASALWLSESSMVLSNSQVAADTATHAIAVHYTADAEL